MIDSSPFNRSAECRYGTLLFNKHDRFIGKSLELYGEYSEGEIDLFRQIVRLGAIVVEVGANIGTHIPNPEGAISSTCIDRCIGPTRATGTVGSLNFDGPPLSVGHLIRTADSSPEASA